MFVLNNTHSPWCVLFCHICPDVSHYISDYTCSTHSFILLQVPFYYYYYWIGLRPAIAFFMIGMSKKHITVFQGPKCFDPNWKIFRFPHFKKANSHIWEALLRWHSWSQEDETEWSSFGWFVEKVCTQVSFRISCNHCNCSNHHHSVYDTLVYDQKNSCVLCCALTSKCWHANTVN